MRKKVWAIWLSLTLLSLVAWPVYAQGAIRVVDQSIESQFRDNITAHISAQGQVTITKVEFFYRVVGQLATSRNVAEFEPGTTVEAQFSIDQTSIYFPPGTEIEYWWKFTDANDNILKTEKQTYLYLDNRHDFKNLSNDRLTLYWYRGGDDFGQALFDQANKALDQLEANVGVSVQRPIKIFIYGSHTDLLDAIAVGAQEWTGGQAFTDDGVVVLGIAPGDLKWGLRATTHELTHLVIHQATDNPYGDLPRWLDEGLAVYNEDPNRLDSQFRSSFERAVKENSLMTLQTLSSSFPADPRAANLAYGESGAVVKFVVDTYGSAAMKNLLDIFSEGELYDKALEQALGVDTRGLDNAWRASLGLPPLITEVQPAKHAVPAVAPATDEAPSTPEAQRPATTPSPNEPPSTSEGATLPCLSGALPLLALGAVVIAKRKKRLV